MSKMFGKLYLCKLDQEFCRKSFTTTAKNFQDHRKKIKIKNAHLTLYHTVQTYRITGIELSVSGNWLWLGSLALAKAAFALLLV